MPDQLIVKSMNLNFNAADPFSLSLFVVMAIAMAFACFYVLWHSVNRLVWTGSFLGVIFISSIAAATRLMTESLLPWGPLVFSTILVWGFTFPLSASGRAVAGSNTLSTLILFQSFRIPLELILHHWADIQTVPETMTWTGQNWDIVAGISSLLSCRWVNRSRALAWTVNTIGFLLLLNVLRVVALSAPLPFSWQLERPLLLIAYFPYSLIAPLFVLPAFSAHLLVFRKLFEEGRNPLIPNKKLT